MKNLKNILSIIILLFSFITFGQEIVTKDLGPNKDIRSELLLKGKVTGVNIQPTNGLKHNENMMFQ